MSAVAAAVAASRAGQRYEPIRRKRRAKKSTIACIAILGGLIAGPMALQPVFAHADTVSQCNTPLFAKDIGNPCLNGNVPSYTNQNCWPGAIYCPPSNSPDEINEDSPDNG